MAIYHVAVKVIKRSAGRSSTAAAAYRSGERIEDWRTGEVHDYTRRSGVVATGIIAPDSAPAWTGDRAELWNQVEATERRRDAQLAREFEVALPCELDLEQRRALVERFCRDELVSNGMVADYAIHTGHIDSRNAHAHILTTLRRVDGDGFAAKKERAWNSKEQLQHRYQAWEQHANRALELTGRDERIGHRTLAAQGIDRTPGHKMAVAAAAMEARGERTERSDLNRKVVHINDAVERRQELDARLARTTEPEPVIEELEARADMKRRELAARESVHRSRYPEAVDPRERVRQRMARLMDHAAPDYRDARSERNRLRGRHRHLADAQARVWEFLEREPLWRRWLTAEGRELRQELRELVRDTEATVKALKRAEQRCARAEAQYAPQRTKIGHLVMRELDEWKRYEAARQESASVIKKTKFGLVQLESRIRDMTGEGEPEQEQELDQQHQLQGLGLNM